MNRIGRIATSTCLGLLAAAPAFAGARIDLEGGAAPVVSSLTAKSVDGVEQGFDVDTAGSYAVGAAWVLDDKLELGGRWQQSFFVDDFLFTDESLSLSSATVGARYHLFDRERLVRPFVAGQVGVAFADASTDTEGLFSDPELEAVSTDDTGFGMNAGGGVDFQLTRWLSVGADVRYNYAAGLDDVHYMTTMFNVGIHRA
jgi:opacity protein-like surface antigen